MMTDAGLSPTGAHMKGKVESVNWLLSQAFSVRSCVELSEKRKREIINQRVAVIMW